MERRRRRRRRDIGSIHSFNHSSLQPIHLRLLLPLSLLHFLPI
jgi:hypothetical protein